MSTKQPWAVLLCKFKNDPSEPPNAPGVLPFRTVCERFFTSKDAGFNLVRYFSDMSHGKIDIGDSKVLGWLTLNASVIGLTPAGDPILDKSQGEIVTLARQAAGPAALAAGIALDRVVVIMNRMTGWAQGTHGWMAADWRRVDGRNPDGTLGARGIGGGNGTEIFSQEMGHGFGLEHSRLDGLLEDYKDPWDAMSALNAYSAADTNYGARGPGINAWNMRSRGWLDEARVFGGSAGGFTGIVELRPLHRQDLPGFLAAELPGVGAHGAYLVEFRVQEDWDAGIPAPTVLVHRFEGSNSYLMKDTSGQPALAVGAEFSLGARRGPRSEVQVLNVDAAARTALVRVSRMPALPGLKRLDAALRPDGLVEVVALGVDGHSYHVKQTTSLAFGPWSFLGGDAIQELSLGRNADGRLELFALALGRVHHKWQRNANGVFGDWSSLEGTQLRSIQVASNADGRLELFALGGDGRAYHRWQKSPNGVWDPWSSLGGEDLQQVFVAANADGRLEMFALGGDRQIYHRWQAMPNGGWLDWAGLGGQQLRQVTVGRNQDGRLELFALGGDRKAYHRWQAAPNGAFGPWGSLSGHDLADLRVAANADGRLELFAMGGDRRVYHRWQTTPNGTWGEWSTMEGTDLRTLLPTSDRNGRLGVLAIGGDGKPYQRWQGVPNGGWAPWSSLG